MWNTEKNNYKISVARVLAFMSQYRKETKRQMIIILLSRLATIVFFLIIPLYYGKIIDTISVETTQWTVALVLPILRAILWRNLCNQVARRTIWWVIVKMEVSMMKKIYHNSFNYLHSHSYRFFTNNFAGSLLKKINKLVRGYESITDTIIFNLGAKSIMVVLMVVFIMREHLVLGLVLWWWTVMFLTIQYRAYKHQMKFDQVRYEYDSFVTGFLADTISNNYTISCFWSQPYESQQFGSILEKRWKLTTKSWINKEYIFTINSILMVWLEFVFVWLMIRLVNDWVFSVWLFAAFQTYVLSLFHQLTFIANDLKRFFASVGEAWEMIEILETPLEVEDKSDAELSITWWAVSVKNIAFDYGEGWRLFDGFSLEIKPGEKIALVWPSGSWKSSIVKLLMRFLDVQWGTISIDGQDISAVSQVSLRSAISIVPQEPLLFHRSLKDNIAYGRPDATMNEIREAARMARCDVFISALDEGYETLVWERWIKLSWWERQRVAIARAILEDKKILILDEATSSLDSESEKMIQDAVHELIQNKTAIVIAHRLSTIKEMDRIIVMQDGKIVEQWSHETLLNMRNGLYHKLWKIQAE